MNKTKEEIIDKVYADANNQLFSVPKQLGCIAMQAYADQQLSKVNDFIRDIGKILGEDGLGFDGLSWSIDDFKNAIDQEKRKEAIAFLDSIKKYERENRELIGFDERESEELYDLLLQPKTANT